MTPRVSSLLAESQLSIELVNMKRAAVRGEALEGPFIRSLPDQEAFLVLQTFPWNEGGHRVWDTFPRCARSGGAHLNPESHVPSHICNFP